MRLFITFGTAILAVLPVTAQADNASFSTGGLRSNGRGTGSSGSTGGSSSNGWGQVTPSSSSGLPGGSGGWGSGGVSHRPDDYVPGGAGDSPTPVPEPATIALMGAGIAGLAAARRRRRKR